MLDQCVFRQGGTEIDTKPSYIRLNYIFLLMFIGPCIIVTVEEWKTNLMSLAILFHLLCAQHVSDINISIIRSFRLCWWITTSVVLFSVRCVLELWRAGFGWCSFCRLKHNCSLHVVCGGWGLMAVWKRTENKTTDVVIHQHSRKPLMMDILMSETCWAHKKGNKIARDIKLVFHFSTTFSLFRTKQIIIFSCINGCSILHYVELLVKLTECTHLLNKVPVLPVWCCYYYVSIMRRTRIFSMRGNLTCSLTIRKHGRNISSHST